MDYELRDNLVCSDAQEVDPGLDKYFFFFENRFGQILADRNSVTF
jgi:hypothetical protein